MANRANIAQVKKMDLDKLPIRTIDFSKPSDVEKHDRLVSLVDDMLDHYRRLADAHDAKTAHVIQKQIDHTDRQIDALVYALYTLTDAEIAIVEGR